MTFQLDLHVHTRLGSLDSTMDPEQMLRTAAERGLAGVGVTEHYRLWSAAEVERYSGSRVTILAGIEVTAAEGHFLVFGVDQAPRSRSLASLAAEVYDLGGALVLAHPFRGQLDHWRRHLLDTAFHPLLLDLVDRGQVHGIEAWNNGCTDAENDLAMDLAMATGLPALGGSDAHVASDVGRQRTRFKVMPRDSRELAMLLRARVQEGGPAQWASTAARGI
ncbi:MAG: PHP domain-containing protein [Chloroflexi bacterium CFX7]|nr:PHP domain-containing protein [Chloroflexi bacterium CFX7]